MGAKTISIVAALRRWNLKEKEEDCCSLHAAVLETQRVMNTLMHRRCKNLIPSANVFCSVCILSAPPTTQRHATFALRICLTFRPAPVLGTELWMQTLLAIVNRCEPCDPMC